MLIAKLSIDGRGRIQLPSTFVKANDWNTNGKVLLKNHTNKSKVSLEYVKEEDLIDNTSPVKHKKSQGDIDGELERKRVEEIRTKVGLY